MEEFLQKRNITEAVMLKLKEEKVRLFQPHFWKKNF
jgi:hypothetical protein